MENIICKPYLKEISGTYQKKPFNGKHLGDIYQSRFVKSCGLCPKCRMRKARNWIVRSHFESKRWSRIYFLTLTYRKTNGLLHYPDLQAFNKRYRHHCKYKFIAAGEYGSALLRPHFHQILFTNDELPLYHLKIKCKDGKIRYQYNRGGNPVYSNHTLLKSWKHGIASILPVENNYTEDCIKYLSLYVTKNNMFKFVLGKNTDWLDEGFLYCNITKQHYSRDEYYSRHKEKIISSQGLGFYEWFKTRLHYYDTEVVYIGGHPYRVPREWIKKAIELGCHNSLDYYLSLPLIDDDELLEQAFKQTNKKYNTILKHSEYHYEYDADYIL